MQTNQLKHSVQDESRREVKNHKSSKLNQPTRSKYTRSIIISIDIIISLL